MKEVEEVNRSGDKKKERIVGGRVVEKLVEEKNASGDIKKEYTVDGRVV